MIIAYLMDRTIREREAIPDINQYVFEYVAGIARHDADSAGVLGFIVNTSGNMYRAATRTVEEEVATCPSSGEIIIEHTFPSGKIPVTRVPFAADRNDWKGAFTFEKTGLTDDNGRAVVKDCSPGVEYLINFYPDYDGTSEAAINQEYTDIIAKMGALLKTEWESKLLADWNSFKALYNNMSEQDKFFLFLETYGKGFWDTLVSLWDMISSIATAIVNHWDDILAGAALFTGPLGAAIGGTYLHSKYADSIKKFISELIEDLKKLERSKIERIFFLLVDKSLLYVVFSAVVHWICLLPPDLLCAFIARGMAEIVVNIVIGVVLTGGAGLAAKVSSQAALVAREAVIAREVVTGLNTVGRLRTYLGAFSGELGSIITRSMSRYVNAVKPAIVSSSHSGPARVIASGPAQVGDDAAALASRANRIESTNNTKITTERTSTTPAAENNRPASTPKDEPSPHSKVCTVDSCPVSMVTGEELLSLDDGELKGLLPFVWKRLYRTSAAEIDNGLGYGWSHCLSHQLVFNEDNVLWTNDENLTTELPLPTQAVPIGINNQAEAAIYWGKDESEIILAQAHGQGFYHFKRTISGAYLDYISDKYDNSIIIERNLDGHICRIHNTAGTGLFIHYQNNHITGVDYQQYTADSNGKATWQTLQPLVRYAYNVDNQLISATNAADESEYYQYDELNVIQERRMAGGAAYYWQWEGQGKNVRCIRHWANFDQLESRYAWDDNGQVTITRKDGSQQVYVHDKNAKLVKEIAPDGGEIAKDYDKQGRLIAERNQLGAQTRYQYDYQGNLRLVIAPTGEVTEYGYDLGRISSVSQGDATWQYFYNDRGDIIWQTDPTGNVTQYEYTETGKIKLIKYPDGSTHQLNWNLLGQLIEEKLPQGGVLRYRYDSLGRQILRQDEFGKMTQIEYDNVNRMTKVTRPDGSSNEFKYNAYHKVTQVTDEQGRITKYEYLPNLHVVSRKINPDGSEIQYQYNNTQLNLSDIINETGQRYHIDYDQNGLVSKETTFEGLVTCYQYDLGGHLIAKTEYDQQGNEFTTTYLRSPTGQLLQKTLPDGKKINYSYNAQGLLSEVDDGDWPINYEYDLSGKLTAEHQGWATLRYQYSPLGILSQCQLPDGNVVDYQHIRGGQLAQVNLNGKKVTEHFYSLGQEVKRQQGSLTSFYQYDDQGRLTSHRVNSLSETLYKRQYQYSPAGNLEFIDDSHKGKREYFYDPLDRLTHVRGDITEDLIHDPAGNLLTQEGRVRQVNIDGNRLLMQGDRHFSYDDFGCLTEERRGQNQQLLTRYQYDAQHQLEKATLPDGTVAEYRYDAFGRRISKIITDKTGHKTKTEFIWQGSKIIAESSKRHYQSYLYEPGTFKPLALLKGKGTEAKIYYYQLDHLGTPQELTDGYGEVCWSARYRAYGNLAVLDSVEIDNPLRFQGQYHDWETGLHYNRYRYYNPHIGRYMSPDPIKLAGGLNSYQYTKNPIVNTDPLGLNNCPLNISDDVIRGSGMTREAFEAKVTHFRDNISTGADYNSWKTRLMRDEGLSETQVREIFYQGSLAKNQNIFGRPGSENWGRYYQEITGNPSPKDPMHAHHLVEKIGGGASGEANRAILREVGINPTLARENFTSAPNKVTGQHGEIPQAELNRRLEAVKGDRTAIEAVLRDWATVCQSRG